MGLFNWHGRRQSGGDKLERIAAGVAERCRHEVGKRVEGLTPRMTAAEARGYIRARAAIVMHREIHHAMVEHRLRGKHKAKLIASTTEALVNLVLRDVQASRSRMAA